MDDNITIKLELAGSDYKVKCLRSEEPLYREAADLIKKVHKNMTKAVGANAGVKEEARLLEINDVGNMALACVVELFIVAGMV